MKKIIIVLLVLILLVSVGFNVSSYYNRFHMSYDEYVDNGSGNGTCKIIVEEKYGVNYLVYVEFNSYGIGVGLTPLLNSEGKIVITKLKSEK